MPRLLSYLSYVQNEVKPESRSLLRIDRKTPKK